MQVGIQGQHTEEDGAIRVQIQDNYFGEMVGVRLCQVIGKIALLTDPVMGSNTITLKPGHGVTAGKIICLKENKRFYQAVAVNVNTDIITLDSPIDFRFSAAADCHYSSDAMNVDGSSIPQVFYVRPPIDTKWDILGFSFNITDNSEMDDAKFGGITALTNGVVVRRKDGDYKNIMNVKSNGEFVHHCDIVNYSTKAPSGSYGLNISKTFNNRHGISVRLNGNTKDEFQIIVQDNLTALASFTAYAWGHVVK